MFKSTFDKRGLSLSPRHPHKAKHYADEDIPCECLAMRLADAYWQAHAATLKPVWDPAVKKRHMSGYELFMKEAMALILSDNRLPAAPSPSGGYSLHGLIPSPDPPPWGDRPVCKSDPVLSGGLTLCPSLPPGTPLSDIPVTASPSGRATLTEADGSWEIKMPYGASGEVEATAPPGLTISPAFRSFGPLTEDDTVDDFILCGPPLPTAWYCVSIYTWYWERPCPPPTFWPDESSFTVTQDIAGYVPGCAEFADWGSRLTIIKSYATEAAARAFCKAAPECWNCPADVPYFWEVELSGVTTPVWTAANKTYRCSFVRIDGDGSCLYEIPYDPSALITALSVWVHDWGIRVDFRHGADFMNYTNWALYPVDCSQSYGIPFAETGGNLWNPDDGALVTVEPILDPGV